MDTARQDSCKVVCSMIKFGDLFVFGGAEHTYRAIRIDEHYVNGWSRERVHRLPHKYRVGDTVLLKNGSFAKVHVAVKTLGSFAYHMSDGKIYDEAHILCKVCGI